MNRPSLGTVPLSRPNAVARQLGIHRRALDEAYDFIPHQVWNGTYRLFPSLYVARLVNYIPEEERGRGRGERIAVRAAEFAAEPDARQIVDDSVEGFKQLLADNQTGPLGVIGVAGLRQAIPIVHPKTIKSWIETVVAATAAQSPENTDPSDRTYLTSAEVSSLYTWHLPSLQGAPPSIP